MVLTYLPYDVPTTYLSYVVESRQVLKETWVVQRKIRCENVSHIHLLATLEAILGVA